MSLIKPQKVIWKTKEGVKIRVCDMTDRHLLNAIAMLERWAPKALASTQSAAWSFLGTLQGDVAQYTMEQEISRLEEMTSDEFLEESLPMYEKLCLERQRRKL